MHNAKYRRQKKNEQCTIASVSSPPAILLRPLSNQKSTRWTDGRLEPSKDLGTVKYYLSSQKKSVAGCEEIRTQHK